MATDITGQVYGRLTVIRLSDERNRDRDRLWVCLCQCGNETLVIARLLRNGATQSCGCWRRQRAKTFTVSVASKPVPHPTQIFTCCFRPNEPGLRKNPQPQHSPK